MIIAKLSKELELIVQLSPIDNTKRVVDTFYVNPVNYTLGSSKSTFMIYFTKEKDSLVNPSSTIKEESITEKVYEIQKVFTEVLTAEELSIWGTNDEALLQIFAKKYGLTISEFIYKD